MDTVVYVDDMENNEPYHLAELEPMFLKNGIVMHML